MMIYRQVTGTGPEAFRLRVWHKKVRHRGWHVELKAGKRQWLMTPESWRRQDRSSTFLIECPATCVERGCTDHVGKSWRTSRTVPAGTPVHKAYRIMQAHAERFPTSGPYRLVEQTASGPRIVGQTTT